MAKTVAIKIPEDIEFRVMGNGLCLMIVSAGLLAGEMIRLRSFDYWRDDIVPLLLMIWLVYRLFRNFLSTLIAYRDEVPPPAVVRDRQIRETLKSEKTAVAQIAAKTGFTAEQVVGEVAKRIEAKKEEALKKNKMVN